MTSRDLTENVEQLQVIRSLDLVRLKAVACLNKLAERAVEFRDLMVTARTHNVPAQATTLGKRFAMAGQELLVSLDRLDDLVERYPARGLKELWKLSWISRRFSKETRKRWPNWKSIVKHLGFGKVLTALAKSIQGVVIWIQLPPWSSWLPAVNLTTTIRLMAGQGLMSEGFRKGRLAPRSYKVVERASVYTALARS